MSDPTRPIADFFDRECCAAVEAGASNVPGATGVTTVLLDALEAAGLRGLSVLELGSGAGQLSRELIERGAASVSGIDLSPMSVAAAAREAQAAGLADQLDYRVGDGALEPLGGHDLVVSHKVICCYPDWRRLLANTLPAAQRTYALVMPESRGLVGLVTRLVVGVDNVVNRLRGEGYRGYVHDVRAVEAAIRDAGFKRRLSERHWSWLVLVFERQLGTSWLAGAGQSPS